MKENNEIRSSATASIGVITIKFLHQSLEEKKYMENLKKILGKYCENYASKKMCK